MTKLYELRKRVVSQGSILSILAGISFIGVMFNLNDPLWIIPLVFAIFGVKMVEGKCNFIDRKLIQGYGSNKEEYY